MTTPVSSQPIATAADVQTALRGAQLTEDQTEQLEQYVIPALSEIVESYLGVQFGVRTTEERLEVVTGRVWPQASPVTQVVSVTRMDGVPVTVWQLAGDSIIVPIEPVAAWLDVVMLAGHRNIPPMLRHFVVNAAARTIAVDPQVAIGVLSSYSVEGTSITYAGGVTNSDADTPGGYSVGELSALDRLRKLTFL